MPGRGPAPKAADRRARRNADPIASTVLTFVAGEQPELPANLEWPEQTREWWAMWGRSPMASLFGESDWSELLDTARIHAAFWSGDLKQAPELRLRVAKFGATPEDRARLRITFASADEADAKRPSVSVSRERFAGISVVESVAS